MSCFWFFFLIVFSNFFFSVAEIVENEDEQIVIDYYRGLPRITVPLPSRKEKCRFTLKPISNTVRDLTTMIQEEDRGIDRVILHTKGL